MPSVYVHKEALNGGEFSEELHARVGLDKFKSGLKKCINYLVKASGGVCNRGGTEYVAEVYDSTKKARVIPFSFNDEQTYQLVFENQLISFYRDGGQVLTENAIVSITLGNPTNIEITGHNFYTGDIVSFSNMVGTVELEGLSYALTVVDPNNFTIPVDSTLFGAFVSGDAQAPYRISSPYLVADLFALNYAQSSDTMIITSSSYEKRRLSRTAHDSWSLDLITVGSTIAAPTGLSVTIPGSGAITHEYVVTALTDTGDESLASTSDSDDTNAVLSVSNPATLTWGSVTGAERYLVYKKRGGSFGYIGSSTTTGFTDDGITPELTDAPPESVDPFASSNHAAGVTFHNQRTVYAGLTNNPQDVVASRLDSLDNFNKSYPLKDSDSFRFTMNSNQSNPIKSLLSFNDLLVFTSSGVFIVHSGNEAFTGPNAQKNKQTGVGISDVRPLETLDSVLYLTSSDRRVFDLIYSNDTQGYTGTDRTILAGHLFETYSIVDWAYAPEPYSIVWCVREDGVLLGLTYVRDHDVWAWHRHTTDGLVESVCAVKEGNETAVYLLINRTINGQTKRYLERMHTRKYGDDITDAYFVDCGIKYNGAPTDTLTGYDHLEGKTVVVLGDGHVFENLTVNNGQITLPESEQVSKAAVGLPYVCDLETLEPVTNEGPINAFDKALTQAYIQVRNTRGISVGPDETQLNEYIHDVPEDAGAPIEPVTGAIEVDLFSQWSRNGTIFIRQRYPLPAEILSIMYPIETGGI